MDSVSVVSEAPAHVIGVDLEGLEGRIERRLAELELRHQRQWERFAAQRAQDVQQAGEALVLAQRCERDVEVLSEQHREAISKLNTVSQAAPKAEEALAESRASLAVASEESRQALAGVERAHESTRSRLEAMASKVQGLISQNEAEASAKTKREVWEKEMEGVIQNVVRRADALHNWITRVKEHDGLVEHIQEDISDLRDRWSDQEGSRSEQAMYIETRLTRFEGVIAANLRDLTEKITESRVSLREDIESRLGEASTSAEALGGVVNEAKIRLGEELERLRNDHMEAVREAWQRVEARQAVETLRMEALAPERRKATAREQPSEGWRVDLERKISFVEDEVKRVLSVWDEVGQLGCRIADLHAMLDAYIGPLPQNGAPLTRHSAPSAPERAAPGQSARGRPAAAARSQSRNAAASREPSVQSTRGRGQAVRPPPSPSPRFNLRLAPKTPIEVVTTFVSGDETETTLKQGERGIVEMVDEDGDALVFFQKTGKRKWILRRDFSKVRSLLQDGASSSTGPSGPSSVCSTPRGRAPLVPPEPSALHAREPSIIAHGAADAEALERRSPDHPNGGVTGLPPHSDEWDDAQQEEMPRSSNNPPRPSFGGESRPDRFSFGEVSQQDLSNLLPDPSDLT